MFTGIIETIGTIAHLERSGGLAVLEVEAGEAHQGVGLGDSVALDGCCLTVTRLDGARLRFEAIPETLRRSSLGERRVGSRVNLERALRAGGRLDGHFVQGHVDGTGRVERLDRQGSDVLLRVACSPELADQIIPKGSIAVDGVSLTVVDPDARGFSVALIPHTLAITTLSERVPGDLVNLELDLLGKYVRVYLERFRDQLEIHNRSR